MAYRSEWLTPHLIAIALSLALAAAAWKRPQLGRGLFALLFAWAAITNLKTAWTTPLVYLDYANLTESKTYHTIITGPFAAHVVGIVSAIALAQACIAVGFLARGVATRLAALGTIVFCVAIAPLGVGSGFPSTLIMAGGAATLLRRTFDRNLFRVATDRVRAWRAEGAPLH